MLKGNKNIGHESKLWSQGTKFTKVSKKFQIWNLPPLDQMYGEKKVLTNFDPNMAKFGQNLDQIWPFSKFRNHPQGFTYFDYQNLKYGPKMLLQLRIIQISQFFLRISKASLTMTI